MFRWIDVDDIVVCFGILIFLEKVINLLKIKLEALAMTASNGFELGLLFFGSKLNFFIDRS